MTQSFTGHGLRLERQFLLPSLPRALTHGTAALVEERFLAGTRLSLRRAIRPTAQVTGVGPWLALRQMVRRASDRTGQLTLTEGLAPDAYEVLSRLPADVLVWRRYDAELSRWPCAVDVFEGELSGLVLAEAAFRFPAYAWSFAPPVYAVAEVTGDDRFSAEALARTSTAELSWLVAEYGMLLP
ncbi:MAG TPA: hypothetical protein VEL73_06505 [Mycobacteriales bacterium]|nr:hypothetical protein [Mycobacteriales bacterium]